MTDNSNTEDSCMRFSRTQVSRAIMVPDRTDMHKSLLQGLVGLSLPMRCKADTQEGLSLLAQRDGVPLRITMDGSKEQTMGLFCRKAIVEF